MSFAKNIGKNLSNKYGQKLLDSAKKYTTDAIKTASKRAIQKTVKGTGDLVENKVADKITSVSKKSSAEHSVELHSKNDDANSEIEVPKKIHISRRKATNYWWIKINAKKGRICLEIIDELRLAFKKRYISPEERQRIIDELRLL